MILSIRCGRGTKCDCKRDTLWVRLPLEEIKYLILILWSGVEASTALSSATHHAMLPEFSSKCGPECHNAMIFLPTLLVRKSF